MKKATGSTVASWYRFEASASHSPLFADDPADLGLARAKLDRQLVLTHAAGRIERANLFNLRSGDLATAMLLAEVPTISRASSRVHIRDIVSLRANL
ncbi:hypothetical protein [Burkholderia cenocepacia]|uniref:hypothetical protein n=1 Tax=Burkholderia cenocepacia TaxID=95486 RepID=UPI001FC87B42|nr:hypothetical protein [Burkholderia cenocepacia]